VRFDKQAGLMTEYRYQGTVVLERGPEPDFWRAPTNNDRGAWKAMQRQAATNRAVNIELWREAGPRWSVKDVRVEKADDATVKVSVSADLPVVGAAYAMTYTVHGDGAVQVDCRYTPGSERYSMMPRFGTELVVAPGFENIVWYGRGPKETMVDRNFERIGVYRSTVDKEWVDYMRPQENGNKTDVRWVKLTNAAGLGIQATGTEPLDVGARHYTKTDMERAGYTFQMKRHPETFLNVDGAQMGAGGIDSWSPNAYPMTRYRIDSTQPHSFSYTLKGISEAPTAKAPAPPAAK
jgi:beta-galactosidase